MINKMIKADQLKLAKVKYYDAEANGIEVNGLDAYAFLMKAGKDYVNVFDLTSNLPIFERVPYSNTTKDGVNYGTKVIQISGEADKSGLCYVLETSTAKDLFEVEELDEEALKRYIVSSKKFFIDRKSIIQDNPSLIARMKALPILLSDEKKHDKLRKFVDSHETGKRY